MAYVSAYPPASCGGGWTRVHGPMEQRLWTMSPSESSVSAQGSTEPSSCPVRAFPPSDRSPRSECCLSREVLEQHPAARLLVLTPPLLGQVFVLSHVCADCPVGGGGALSCRAR